MPWLYRLLATWKRNRKPTAAAFSVLENTKMEVYKNYSLLNYIIINFIRYVQYKSVKTLKYYWGKTCRLTNYASVRSPAFCEIKSRLNSKQSRCLLQHCGFRHLVNRSQNLNKTRFVHRTLKTYVVKRILTKNLSIWNSFQLCRLSSNLKGGTRLSVHIYTVKCLTDQLTTVSSNWQLHFI